MPGEPPFLEPPMWAIEAYDWPGILHHHDFNGDRLDDLLMFTVSNLPYGDGNLLLFPNASR